MRIWVLMSIVLNCSILIAQVQDVDVTKPIKVPYIFWGGDVPTFIANGGDLKTLNGSVYNKLGINIEMYAGDDFKLQVQNYLSGKSPFLRATVGMLSLYSETISQDPRTKPVAILQLTWSQGDHCAARNNIKSVNDFKGKKICLQKDGPHVQMLDELLNLAKISWKEIEVVYVNDLTGPNGVAEKFRADESISACFVVTPDMIGLTGGPDSKGGDAEGNVKDAHVLVSTETMNRSIADCYFVRTDFYTKNRDFVNKFTAGYFSSTKSLLEAKNEYEKNNSKSKNYNNFLLLTQKLYGKELIPTLDIDAHGLICDAIFVGIPGNISFFQDTKDPISFDSKMSSALDMAINLSYIKTRNAAVGADIDYKKIADIAGIEYKIPSKQTSTFNAETLDSLLDDELDESKIVSFTINFKENQDSFPVDVYGSEFDRVIKGIKTLGKATLVIKGHADPTYALVSFIKLGMAKGVIKRSGTKGNYIYVYNGDRINMSNINNIIKLIENSDFDSGVTIDGNYFDPRATIQAANHLSETRSQNVKNAIISYAKSQGVDINESQIRIKGIGVREPLIPNPKSKEDCLINMRVEFMLIKTPAEAINNQDFDY